MSLSILIIFYALITGAKRFGKNHLNQQWIFNWKKHVLLGKISIISLIIGALIGIIVVRINWKTSFITGIHAYIPVIIFLFILFGFIAGLYMDRNKKKRNVLPILHGIGNAIVFILAIFQIITGIKVFTTFVLGI